MEISTNDLTAIATGAVAVVGGAGFGLRKLMTAWTAAGNAQKAVSGEGSYIDRIERENKELRTSEREARNQLADMMRNMGRLEALEEHLKQMQDEYKEREQDLEKQIEKLETQVEKLNSHIDTQTTMIEDQSKLIQRLTEQNKDLLDALAKHGGEEVAAIVSGNPRSKA